MRPSSSNVLATVLAAVVGSADAQSQSNFLADKLSFGYGAR
jgi:hypothetical protein